MIKKIFLIFAFGFLLLLPTKIFAADPTSEQITSFDSQITINADASISVKETINSYFPSAKHGIYRYLPYRYLDQTNNQYFKTTVNVIGVTNASGIPWNYTESTDGTYLTLQIGDAAKTIEGPQTYVISYSVAGVINYFEDPAGQSPLGGAHDELYWNVTGNSWTVPIGKTTASVTLPAGFDSTQIKLTCYTGESGSKSQNCQNSLKNDKASFSADAGPLTIVVGFNKGLVSTVTRQYQQPSGFDKFWNKVHHESAWYLFIIPLSLVLLLIRYFRRGRDPFGRGTIAPEFEPPDNLKPAEMGTLVDEKANNADISSTIIDLAVRGYLKIKEKDKKYTLIKTKEIDEKLDAFEKQIYNDLFEGRSEAKLSEIHDTFGDDIENLKTDLYEDLVKRGYFNKDPNKVRVSNFWQGCLIMFVAPFLSVFAVSLAVAVFISGMIYLFFTRSTPKKTKAGVIAKEKSLGFKEFLYRAERYRVKWQEKEGIFEKYLPYAMVFGIAEVWAKNFQDIYKKPPDWYEGNWTTFNAVYLATSLSSFSTTASSSYSPPSTSASSGASGFGGGGFSGGGFGGGGGGSW